MTFALTMTRMTVMPLLTQNGTYESGEHLKSIATYYTGDSFHHDAL